jgi:hypothetical protein
MESDKMKKIRMTVMLLVLMLIAVSGSAFAQGLGGPPAEVPRTGPEARENMQHRLVIGSMVREKAMTIRDNNLAIRDLVLEIKGAFAEVREAIGEAEELQDGELAEIREKLRLIRQNRKAIGETVGGIRAEAMRMRQNRGDGPAVMTSLDVVIQIQEARMAILTEILDDIRDLLTTL